MATTEILVKVENVSFKYHRNIVLNRINLDFIKGKSYAIVGKSGAGKSTLLNLIYGFIRPHRGRLYYNGMPLKNKPENRIFI